jgi:hypothetical protein
MMVYNTQDYWKTQRFVNGICFRPQVKGGGNKTPTQLGPLERANLNERAYLDPVIEISSF